MSLRRYSEAIPRLAIGSAGTTGTRASIRLRAGPFEPGQAASGRADTTQALADLRRHDRRTGETRRHVTGTRSSPTAGWTASDTREILWGVLIRSGTDLGGDRVLVDEAAEPIMSRGSVWIAASRAVVLACGVQEVRGQAHSAVFSRCSGRRDASVRTQSVAVAWGLIAISIDMSCGDI